jgi:two-component system sensor histidine kinase/response regulator
LPTGIDGLDTNNGLRRVLGKKPLYLSMLRKFVTGQKFVTSKIFNELENNNWDAAMLLAHTLKGVSGNIGATKLQSLAENLEIAIKKHDPREEVNGRLDVLVEPLGKAHRTTGTTVAGRTEQDTRRRSSGKTQWHLSQIGNAAGR